MSAELISPEPDTVPANNQGPYNHWVTPEMLAPAQEHTEDYKSGADTETLDELPDAIDVDEKYVALSGIKGLLIMYADRHLKKLEQSLESSKEAAQSALDDRPFTKESGAKTYRDWKQRARADRKLRRNTAIGIRNYNLERVYQASSEVEEDSRSMQGSRNIGLEKTPKETRAQKTYDKNIERAAKRVAKVEHRSRGSHLAGRVKGFRIKQTRKLIDKLGS